MKSIVNLLSLITAEALMVSPAFAQIASPEPEGFRIGLTGIVIGILVLIIGGVAVVFFVRKFTEAKEPAERDRPAKPPKQGANEFGESQSQPRKGSTSKVGAVFISYRRQDSADITGRICDRLVERIGNDAVYKDVDSIPLGVDFRKHLQNYRLCAVGNGAPWESHRRSDRADIAPLEDYAVMLCGQVTFVSDLARQFRALGVTGDRIITEEFEFR